MVFLQPFGMKEYEMKIELSKTEIQGILLSMNLAQIWFDQTFYKKLYRKFMQAIDFKPTLYIKGIRVKEVHK